MWDDVAMFDRSILLSILHPVVHITLQHRFDAHEGQVNVILFGWIIRSLPEE
jgi:hypothetical protein